MGRTWSTQGEEVECMYEFGVEVSQSINLLLNYIIRQCPLNPRVYGAQTNSSSLKTTAYGYLHTTKISLNSTSVINII
jgi:antitoxin component of RelBE/YafQ-DinJ toxin-antitoxin module